MLLARRIEERSLNEVATILAVSDSRVSPMHNAAISKMRTLLDRQSLAA